MKKLILFLMISSVAWHVQGQSTNISNLFQNNFRKAELMYNQQGYRNAIDLYRIVLNGDPGNRQAKARVADCYYRMGQYEEANRWYKELVRQGTPAAEEYYQLGQVLCVLERYDSAERAFTESLKLNGGDPRAASKIEFIHNMRSFLRDSLTYSIERQWYNSNESDFSPRHYETGIVFVSSRDRDLFIKRKSLSGISENEALLNAFYVGPTFDSTKTAEEQVSLFYSKALNSPYHDGPVTFYENGKRIAFTRNFLKNGKPQKDDQGRVNLELYFATLGENRTMTELEAFPYNDLAYSIAHPWVSNDGTVLYFSSNMPGGYGGADLYVSYLQENQWTKPENLGETINTAGDEYSPFLWNDELLFYASNGLGGFGGLDNFVAKKSKDKLGAPKNLGYPVNSSKDDFGIIVDPSGTDGFFASNRRNGNDDVFSFNMMKVTLAGHVRDQVSRQPVSGAAVVIVDDRNQVVSRFVSDESGNFLAELDIKKAYTLTPAKDGYTALESKSFFAEKATLMGDTLSIPIWRNGLFAKGKIYSNEQQTILANAGVYLHNITTGKMDSVISNSIGEYSFMVLPNQSYRVFSRYTGYLENGFNLNTKSLFSGDLVNDILLEETYQEKMVVQFDYDKWDLRPSFMDNLGKIVRSLNRFKDATVYIGAHADTRGTKEYNKALSDKRANAVLVYLKSRNIDVKRIQAFGFGEELILNTCSDGVECSDEEHSLNRRAEIKVQLLGNK